MANGYLKSEDLITVDTAGDFYITGRKNDFINVLGKKVSPQEIENTLLSFSEISECCVTSEVDPDRGQRPVLHLVAKTNDLNKELFEKQYLEKLSGQVEDFKIPRKIVWHNSLPKSPLGKILKSKL